MKKCTLIVNAKAGKQKIKGHLVEIVQLLNQYDYRCVVEVTRHPGHARKIAENETDTELIIACGGDGTLNEVINGLMSSNYTGELGYIPCGTTNDFASSMHLSKNCLKAAEDIAKGHSICLDIGRMDQHYFSYIASFGAFTESVYQTDQNLKNALGYIAYLLEGAKSIGDIRPIRMKITTESDVLEDEYLFGAVANSTSIAGILKLDENLVRMNDGLFEVLLIRCPKDIPEIAKIANYINSRDYNNDFIRLIQTKSVKVECDHIVHWNFDGEFVEGKRSMNFELVPGAIQLIK